tara:strand:+ start:1492 stop:1773 length:282 start_codon:yes stop_codon:yes gene_type:complete
MSSNSMQVINFNRNQLSQREKFKYTLGGYKEGKTTEYNLPKATVKQLKSIRKRLVEERKIRMFKVILVTAIIFLMLLWVFLFSADGFVQLLTY